MTARRLPRPRPLARLLATTAIGVLVAATVSYAMAGQPTSHVASANVSFTAGSFSSSNSRDGAAIFSARNVRPGSGTSGQVTIANSGQVAGSFSLARSGLSDNAGASGGRLSDLAGLAVSDVTRPGAPIPLYAGSLAAMPTLRLGAFAPGEAHTYAFTVTLPAAAPGGADINAYQSSSLQVDYAWRSTGEAPPVADPSPSRTTPSPAPPASSPPSSSTPSSPNPPGPGPGSSAGPSPGTPSRSAGPAPGTSSGGGATPHASSHRGAGGGTSGDTGPSAIGGAGTGSTAAGGVTASGDPSAPGIGSPVQRARRSGPAARHHAPNRHASAGTARAKPHHPSESLLSSLLSAIGRVVSAIVEHGAFPFGLLLLMLAFFYAQYWLDRRDPKLALAPVDSEPARSFE